MAQPSPSTRQGWRKIFRRLSDINIRLKIVGPYLILTLIVAISGIYMVTRLVSGSLDERLNNHLLEAGRVVVDTLTRKEVNHRETARAIAYTSGFAEALQSEDIQTLNAIAEPVAVNDLLECLIVVNAQGQPELHLLRQSDGSYLNAEYDLDPQHVWVIQALLNESDPNAEPKRAIGQHPDNDRYYYFTAVPIKLNDTFIGVITVGTSLDRLLPQLESTSLADVTIFLNEGQAIATTLTSDTQADTQLLLDELSLLPETYARHLQNLEFSAIENLDVGTRTHRVARGPLRVGNESLGVFSVALPMEFIITAGKASRNNYFALFAGATLAVVAVGYATARLITRPLEKLVQTSQAIAEGNLHRRTGIKSSDEIGVLASTFDGMTENLEQRNAELKELLRIQKETATRMRSILASIADGVLLEETGGVITPLNHTAKKMMEQISDDFMYGALTDLTVSKRGAEDNNLNPWLLEGRFQSEDKIISVHSAAVITDDNQRLGTVIVLRDITAEVEAEHIKDAFIEHVSHELRTPLTVIKGYSNLLVATSGDSLSSQQQGFLQTISNHTENLITMINALLDFSEMAAKGRLGLRPQPVELEPMLEELMQEWQPKIEDKGLRTNLNIASGIPTISADKPRLRWALVNLIRNAWQYTEEDGEINITLAVQDKKVSLQISDTGIGIATEDQKRLFQRFYRIRNVDDDMVRGLGLGLYVTKAIIDAHGGAISADSELGVGSTFKITLPIVSPEVLTAED